MTILSTSTAIDYTRNHFQPRYLFPDFAVHGAIVNSEDSTLRDVLFTLEGHTYRMTVWQEENLDGTPTLYGEW